MDFTESLLSLHRHHTLEYLFNAKKEEIKRKEKLVDSQTRSSHVHARNLRDEKQEIQMKPVKLGTAARKRLNQCCYRLETNRQIIIQISDFWGFRELV